MKYQLPPLIPFKNNEEVKQNIYKNCDNLNKKLLEAFFKFNETSPDFKFVLAGRFMLSSLINDFRYSSIDIDIFPLNYGNEKDLDQILKPILLSLDIKEEYNILQTDNTITIYSKENKIPFQIILRKQSYIEELLILVDFVLMGIHAILFMKELERYI